MKKNKTFIFLSLAVILITFIFYSRVWGGNKSDIPVDLLEKIMYKYDSLENSIDKKLDERSGALVPLLILAVIGMSVFTLNRLAVLKRLVRLNDCKNIQAELKILNDQLERKLTQNLKSEFAGFAGSLKMNGQMNGQKNPDINEEKLNQILSLINSIPRSNSNQPVRNGCDNKLDHISMRIDGIKVEIENALSRTGQHSNESQLFEQFGSALGAVNAKLDTLGSAIANIQNIESSTSHARPVPEKFESAISQITDIQKEIREFRNSLPAIANALLYFSKCDPVSELKKIVNNKFQESIQERAPANYRLRIFEAVEILSVIKGSIDADERTSIDTFVDKFDVVGKVEIGSAEKQKILIESIADIIKDLGSGSIRPPQDYYLAALDSLAKKAVTDFSDMDKIAAELFQGSEKSIKECFASVVRIYRELEYNNSKLLLKTFEKNIFEKIYKVYSILKGILLASSNLQHIFIRKGATIQDSELRGFISENFDVAVANEQGLAGLKPGQVAAVLNESYKNIDTGEIIKARVRIIQGI